METLTNGQLVRLRSTLRTLKQSDAVSGDTRLAYAVDKSLREVESALEAYDDATDELVEEYKQTDEEGRDVVSFRGIPLVRIDAAFHHAETGKEFASVDDLSQMADRLPLKLADVEAYNDEIEVLRDEESEVSLHKIEADSFFDHADLDGVHSRVDLTALELIFNDE